MVEDTVCTIGVYGGRQPSILVNNHLVYGRMPDSETQPDIIVDVPKNRLVANLNPASDGMTDSPRLPLELFAAWLANGDVGISSLAIVQRLTGHNDRERHAQTWLRGHSERPRRPTSDTRNVRHGASRTCLSESHARRVGRLENHHRPLGRTRKTVSERGTQSIRLRPQNLPDTETIEGRKPCLTKTSKPNHGS